MLTFLCATRAKKQIKKLNENKCKFAKGQNSI